MKTSPQHKSLTPNKLGVKRLFLDLEVSPNLCTSWRVGYKIGLHYANIVKERAIICAAWKFEGEDKVHTVHWDKDQNDKGILETLIPIINSADELVLHNGDRFDIPWLRTRCLFHGLPPISPFIKTIDTLQWARRKFYFNSNRLDYIGQYLGFGGKVKTEDGLWTKVVLEKDAKALRDMIRYCQGDIVLLEKVYHKLAPMMRPKTHAGVGGGLDRWSCPYTGSTDVHLSKTRTTASGTKQYQMLSSAGRYFTINEGAYQAYLEAKR